MKSSSVKVKAGVCLDPAVTIKTVSGIEGGWEGGIMPLKWCLKRENYLKSCVFKHLVDWNNFPYGSSL